VLVAENNILKISDFGLTRAIYKDVAYTQKSKGRLPLKWMAVESIVDRVFTTQSDVWSFGVVLWEICTLGGFPYPTILTEHLLEKLKENYRMERPENCSEDLYSIMMKCWRSDPETRPSFSTLTTEVDRLMTTETPDAHVDLNFDTHDQYWLSVSELGDSDSDDELDIPFQDINTHLEQILFTEGSAKSLGTDKQSLSPTRMPKQCVKEGISRDRLQGHEHSSNKVFQFQGDHATMQNGHSSPASNGFGVHPGVENGRVPINGHPLTAGRYNVNLEYVSAF
jgi:serine/threonine protein kinase